MASRSPGLQRAVARADGLVQPVCGLPAVGRQDLAPLGPNVLRRPGGYRGGCSGRELRLQRAQQERDARGRKMSARAQRLRALPAGHLPALRALIAKAH